MLNPLIVGKWDGNHVWLQWTPTPEKSYALRLRYLRPGKTEWSNWIETHTPWPFADSFLRIPTHAEGTRVQAQVAAWPAGTVFTPEASNHLAWETAQARTFGYCEADFEFLSTGRKVTFTKGDFFSVTVDGAVASYHLMEDTDVPVDTPVRARMRSIQMSGNNQLDYPGHFTLTPRPGVTVKNLQPSENDLQSAPGDAVAIERGHPGGPMVISFGAVNQPRP